jgi:hypothetical protein
VSFAVAEARGGIHKYVGDEVIATWRLAPGENPPACVKAAFAALDRIAVHAPAYQREFGVVPDFRAGLHCGPVAVGELGSLRREIALIGDTMNTTARILEACRDTDNRMLASPRPSSSVLPRCLPASLGAGLGSSPCAARSADLSLMCWSQRGSRELKGRALWGNPSMLSEMSSLARANEPGLRISSPTWREGAPRGLSEQEAHTCGVRQRKTTPPGCLRWVMSRNTHGKQITTALPPQGDIS